MRTGFSYFSASDQIFAAVKFNLSVVLELSPSSHGSSQVFEHEDSGLPIDASVCNADALFQGRGALGWDLLVAFVDIRFDHDADYGHFTFAKLFCNSFGDLWLVVVVFLRIS